MKVLEIILEAKTAKAPAPRNFVAKHAKSSGAGKHKDQKKAMKQGDIKHKAKAMAEGTMDYSIDPSITDFASISIIKKLKRDVHDKRLPADPKEIMRAGAELARYYKTELNLPLLAKQVLSGYTKGVAERYNLGGLLPGKYYLHSIYMDSEIFKDPQSGKPMAFNSFDDAEDFRGRMSGREYDEYQVSLFNNGQLQPVDEDIVEGSGSTVASLDAVFNEHDFYRLERIWPALEAGDKEEALRQINHYLNRGKNRAWWGDLQALDIKIDPSDVENSMVKWSKPVQQGVEEAGFVDVTGWSPSQVRAMGRADDDGIGYYSNRNKPNLIAWVFYNVEPGQEDQAATLNIRKLKSGKWAMPVYDKSGATYRFQRNKADQVFGPGKRWDIKKEQSNVDEEVSASTTSSGGSGFGTLGAIYPNVRGKTRKNKDGTAKNALDTKANLLTGGSIKR